MYVRPYAAQLAKRIAGPRRFIQVVSGPRQAGKTTLVRQVAEAAKLTWHYASADEPTLRDPIWIAQNWDLARLRAAGNRQGALLILDEIQKIPNWSDAVKRLWDEDSVRRERLKVILLGSAPLLIQRGLSESLAGRFEVLRLPHWSYAEMREAFGWNVEQYLFYGGYPGAVPLIREPKRWANYIVDSLIETTLSRDVLLLTRVDKPALLRRLFQLACSYSGQILSYQKMLGQLHEAGNTTTLAHYLELLAGAGMVIGLQKFAGDEARQRGSSPKFQVLNTALMTASSGMTLARARANPDFWGRLTESVVGAYLANGVLSAASELFYWRDHNREVDFVLRRGRALTAIEVKSGRAQSALPGMAAFVAAFKPKRKLLIGAGGVSIEEFLSKPVEHWIAR